MSVTNAKIALGDNVFANTNVWQGQSRCHIRYHKMLYDERNQIVYIPTKFGICLNYQQLCHLANNINILVTEMSHMNGDQVMSTGEPVSVPNSLPTEYVSTDVLNVPDLMTTPPPMTTRKSHTYRKKARDVYQIPSIVNNQMQ